MEDNVKLIQELETLKQKVAHYETTVQPLADVTLNRIREEQVKAYKLTEAEQAIMQERLAEVSTEEGIKETALQLAGQFRAVGQPKFTDPISMGNGAKRTPSVKSLHSKGVDTFNQVMHRNSKQISSVSIPSKPLAPATGSTNIFKRLFKRK